MPEGVLPAARPPESFGRVDPDGTVYLRLPDGSERQVGQFASDQPEAALALYVRRYRDLVTETALASTRLANDRLTPANAGTIVARLREALAAPSFVGDLALLVSRVGQLEVLINVKRAAIAEQRRRTRGEALGAREALVGEAEQLADSTAWRATNDRFGEIVERWKAIPVVDRAREQAAWKRIAAARASFDRRRKAHYHELEAERAAAKARKEALIKEAEKLAKSRDWESTTRAYRKLLDRWKEAGRAGKSDDPLWARFHAAQDGFFAARQEIFDHRGSEEREALVAKEGLLDAADRLLPVTDLRAAKRDLRLIQDKWEKLGHVPRGDVKRIEARLRKVEDAVRAAEQERWKKANPDLKSRASDTVGSFQAKIDKMTRQADEARAAGNDDQARKLEQAIESARVLLAAAERGLQRLT